MWLYVDVIFPHGFLRTVCCKVYDAIREEDLLKCYANGGHGCVLFKYEFCLRYFSSKCLGELKIETIETFSHTISVESFEINVDGIPRFSAEDFF